MDISIWGWSPYFEENFRAFEDRGLIPGRVVRESRHSCSVICAEGELLCEVSGAFHYRAADSSAYPITGDWCALRPAGDDRGIIEEILPRHSAFFRQTAGEKTERQVLAANIDILALVFAIDGGRNFTPSSLERYYSLALQSGAEVYILLNKAELCTPEEREAAREQALRSAPGAGVLLISALTGLGLEALPLPPGKTIGLTGPSGVGKSTLINHLAGNDFQKTTAQREQDKRGRHTTSHRQMFRLETGALFIDTPGMRELQLWGDDSGVDAAFEEIGRLARDCRFADCRHQDEPGCAVREALTAGELEPRRYESYQKLKKEMQYLKIRQDEQASRAEREKWKDIAKLQKEFKKQKKR